MISAGIRIPEDNQNLGTFKFLPGFMTCLIQWGHKPSKNSKSVENHIFRGHAMLMVSIINPGDENLKGENSYLNLRTFNK